MGSPREAASGAFQILSSLYRAQICLFLWVQLADAAEDGEAEGAEELRALAQNGGLRKSSTATAVYDCRYRPYIARQASALPSI